MRCIREIGRDGAEAAAAGSASAKSVLILPDAQCGDAKPRDREPCGLQDCPPRWSVGDWSSCSVSCGQGEQRRIVLCEMSTADGKLRRYNPPTPCRNLQKPAAFQLCDLGKSGTAWDRIEHVLS